MDDTPRNIVIVGGGVMGCTTAYYLTRHPKYNPEIHTITIVEAAGIASSASGKAGGLLGLWAYPEETVPLSYRLHRELAEEHGGDQRWGYRRLQGCGTIRVDLQAQDAIELGLPIQSEKDGAGQGTKAAAPVQPSKKSKKRKRPSAKPKAETETTVEVTSHSPTTTAPPSVPIPEPRLELLGRPRHTFQGFGPERISETPQSQPSDGFGQHQQQIPGAPLQLSLDPPHQPPLQAYQTQPGQQPLEQQVEQLLQQRGQQHLTDEPVPVAVLFGLTTGACTGWKSIFRYSNGEVTYGPRISASSTSVNQPAPRTRASPSPDRTISAPNTEHSSVPNTASATQAKGPTISNTTTNPLSIDTKGSMDYSITDSTNHTAPPHEPSEAGETGGESIVVGNANELGPTTDDSPLGEEASGEIIVSHSANSFRSSPENPPPVDDPSGGEIIISHDTNSIDVSAEEPATAEEHNDGVSLPHSTDDLGQSPDKPHPPDEPSDGEATTPHETNELGRSMGEPAQGEGCSGDMLVSHSTSSPDASTGKAASVEEPSNDVPMLDETNGFGTSPTDNSQPIDRPSTEITTPHSANGLCPSTNNPPSVDTANSSTATTCLTSGLGPAMNEPNNGPSDGSVDADMGGVLNNESKTPPTDDPAVRTADCIECSQEPWHKVPKLDEITAATFTELPLPVELDWVKREVVSAWEEQGFSGRNETAQVHPYQFTTSMAALAQERGVRIRLGTKVTKIDSALAKAGNGGSNGNGVHRIELLDRNRNYAWSMEGVTDVVVTAGPWTSTLLPQTKVRPVRAHSVVWEADVSPFAVFTSISLPDSYVPAHRAAKGEKRKHKKWVDPEAYARPFGEVYACGEIDELVPLPPTADLVEADEGQCEDLIAYLSLVSPALAAAPVKARQACYMPERKPHPVFGQTLTPGLWVAAGHSCWGIQHAPATGLLMAEMMMDGRVSSIEPALVAKFDPRRARI